MQTVLQNKLKVKVTFFESTKYKFNLCVMCTARAYKLSYHFRKIQNQGI